MKNKKSLCFYIIMIFSCIFSLELIFIALKNKIFSSFNVNLPNEPLKPTYESSSFINNAKNSTDDTADKYKQAISFIQQKKYPQAIGLLSHILDYKNSKDLINQLQYIINGSYIGNGIWAVGAITEDGGVQVAYNGDNLNHYSAVHSWKNIKSISFRGGDSMEGLTSDGTIITTSDVTIMDLLKSSITSINEMAEVVKAVRSWTKIKSFQTYYPQSAVALDSNGFVYAALSHREDGTVKLNGWDNIIAVENGRSYIAGLKSDGTIVYKNYDFIGKLDTSMWSHIVAISASAALVGLKEDGTVVATGLNRFGEGDVTEWNDIIAISTWKTYTLGLKRDGTVIAAGNSFYGATDVENWRDIVAIQAGSYFSIGLKSDGSMVISGNSIASGVKTPDVSNMNHLYVPKIELGD